MLQLIPQRQDDEYGVDLTHIIQFVLESDPVFQISQLCPSLNFT